MSSVAEQVKLEELESYRLVECEVDQVAGRVQFILHQRLPRTALVEGAWHAEPPCLPVRMNRVLDLKTRNASCAVAHLHCEPLPSYLSLLGQPVVVDTVGESAILTQDENATCGVTLVILGGALNNLWLQWTITFWNDTVFKKYPFAADWVEKRSTGEWASGGSLLWPTCNLWP